MIHPSSFWTALIIFIATYAVLGIQRIPKIYIDRPSGALLGAVATLAGNLTIIGSVANLIVLEASKEDAQISFWEYFKVGAPVTALTLLIGVLIIRW